MQKSILITYDGPSFEAFIFDAIDKAIKLNQNSIIPLSNTEPYADFGWLCSVCSGIPESTLRIKSAAGKIPGVKKVGKRVIYEKAAVLQWLRDLPTRQPAPSRNEIDEAAEEQVTTRLANRRTKRQTA